MIAPTAKKRRPGWLQWAWRCAAGVAISLVSGAGGGLAAQPLVEAEQGDAAPAVPPAVLDFAVLGHAALVDVAEGGDGHWWSLGGDGLVVEWSPEGPVGWARVARGRALALDANRLVVVTPTRLHVYGPRMERIGIERFDGTAACRAAQSVWVWRQNDGLEYVSAAGRVSVPGEAPPADARCSVGGGTAALAWDDGFGAVAVTSDGARLDNVWYGDAAPRAVRDGQGWRMLLPEEASRFAGVACDLVDGPSPSACVWPPERRRSVVGGARPVIGAALLTDGIAIADRAGWTAIVSRGGAPSVVRLDGPVVGVVDGPYPVVLTCARDRVLQVREAGTGAVIDERAVSACPRDVRTVAGRPTVDDAGEPVVFSFVDRRLVGGGRAGGRPTFSGFSVHEAWSAVCAGPSYSVYDRDTTRVYGPECSVPRLVDVRDATGRIAGVLVCSAEGRRLAALRSDGSPFASTDGLDCALEEVRLRASDAAVVEAAPPWTIRIEGTRTTLSSPAGDLRFLVLGGEAVVASSSGIWASDGLWRSLVWWGPDGAHRATERETEAVWIPHLLSVAVRSIRQPPPDPEP